TVFRADAAVIDHVVQAFRAVHSRMHWADRLARRVLAVHARHGLEERPFGFGLVALVVSVDANPVHLAAARDLFFADDGNVVFRLAGDHAAVTADATVQVDRHAPGVAVALIFVIEILIQREFVKFFLLRLPFLRQLIFLVLEFFERAFAENVAAIHREVRLRRSYDETTAGLADDRAAADPRRVRKANVVSVEAAVRQRSIRISLILILGADAAGF